MMKKRTISCDRDYKTVALDLGYRVGLPYWTRSQKVLDQFLSFGIGQSDRIVNGLTGDVLTFVNKTEKFVEAIVDARENRNNVRVYRSDLIAITERFTNLQDDIYYAQCAVGKKLLRYNITTVSLRSIVTIILLLIVLCVVLCINAIAIPIQLSANTTYTIPSAVVDRVLTSIEIFEVAPNNTITGGTIAEANIIIDYEYPRNLIVNPESTMVNTTFSCDTASVFSCNDLSNVTSYFGIAIFCLSLLWFVVLLFYVKLSSPKGSFFALQNRLVDLQKKLLGAKRAVNLAKTMCLEKKHCDDQYAYYDIKVLYKQRYRVIFDRYLSEGRL